MSRRRTLCNARTGVPWRLRFARMDEQVDGFGDCPSIQRAYAALAADGTRNDMILAYMPAALEAGRSPMLIAERRDHAEYLADRLEGFARNVVLLRGELGLRRRRETAERLDAIPDVEERALVAVGRYVDEGFDETRLDTLFLAMPASWKGHAGAIWGRASPLASGQARGDCPRLF